MHCRILNIGLDSEVCRSLEKLLDEGASLQHIETGTIALDILRELPESDLPHIIVIPFRLPILWGADFVAEMRRNPELRSIPVFVWGAHMRADEIQKLYEAGATSVLPGDFNSLHLEALRQFCRKRNGTEADLPRSKPRSEVIVHDSELKPVRNVRLGVLFVWTASISTVLWGCSLLQLGTTYSSADLAPLPIYGALASAGFSLMWRRAIGRARTHYD